MLAWLSEFFGEASLAGLFIYSFLAATLLPGGSELALALVVASSPELFWTALLLATVGNTLGGLTSYLCGRFLPPKPGLQDSRAGRWLRRYGTAALLLSWLPLVGDLLCVAAGWLRLAIWRASFFIAVGKFLRYWIVAEGVRRSLL